MLIVQKKNLLGRKKGGRAPAAPVSKYVENVNSSQTSISINSSTELSKTVSPCEYR